MRKISVRADWSAWPTYQDLVIPDDVTPDELDEYVRDNLTLPSVELDYWEQISG